MQRWKKLFTEIKTIEDVVNSNMEISFHEAEIIEKALDAIVELFEKCMVPDDEYYEYQKCIKHP